jgi:hypothetical protein
MASVREDIHVRASIDEVFARLAPLERCGEWLPAAFREADATGGTLSFRLALPLDSRIAELTIHADERPAYLELRALPAGEDDAPALDGLTWALHVEGPRHVHVTVEAAYTPAPGFLGGLLEPAIHRPLRRQALRDAVWRLKQVAEGRGPSANGAGRP